MTKPWAIAAALLGAACGTASGEVGVKAQPEYNRESGRLERLVADRNKDGKPDTWAYMDGVYTARIEIDQDGDGRPDRTEFYARHPVPGATPPSVIERAEDRARAGDAVIRREFYRAGVLERVEEDTSGDGRPDKWEHYEAGVLARIDLDLSGRGTPERRLLYDSAGTVRVEVDPDGDGVFVPAPVNGK